MQVQGISKQTFNGGFRLKNLETSIREELPSVVEKRGKQIFYDFEKQGDVFVLCREKLDKHYADFIKKHNLKFEYYPTISTSTRALDCEEPEGLTGMLKELQPPFITNFRKMKELIHEKSIPDRPIHPDVIKKEEIIENDNKLLEKAGIEFGKAKHSVEKSIHIIEDYNQKIYVSPQSKYGIKYVLQQPKSIEQRVERYAISQDGKILANFRTPSEITQFKKNFNATLPAQS